MKGKKGLIMGVANERSIAWGISQKLAEAGAPASANFCEIPQAIERSLATPIIKPFLPFIKSMIYTFSKIRAAFVPPNPKLLDITVFNVAPFSVFETIGNFLASSSISEILAEPVIKLFFIIIKQ